jgi:5-methyltetrahydropteroyltriglutamate--homocysteine methyltransferase
VPAARAETVGSLMRPDAIVAQLHRVYDHMDIAVPMRSAALPDRMLELAELNRLADGAIRDVVERQIDAGLDVVTDGEFRRTSFLSSFYDASEGLRLADRALEARDANGDLQWAGPHDPFISGKVRKTGNPVSEEVSFLRAITDHPFKVTFPSASSFLFDFVPIEAEAYADRDAFASDAVAITRQLVEEAIGAGARWVQFDFPIYPLLTDERHAREMTQRTGQSAQQLLRKALELDVAVVAGLPAEVTTALHLCRGNIDGGGFWDGSLGPIAEELYATLPYDRFLFEWEDIARDGDYEPIKFVPKGKTMVMGLISTKTPVVEDEDDVVRSLEAASRYLDVDQLALCTQCGFASLCEDERVESDQAQWEKIELIGRVADRVWGSR